MTLVQPAPRLISGEPVPRHQRDASYIHVRRRPEVAEVSKPAADETADDTPATRSDIARLEGQLAGLLAREEQRDATLARIEDAALCALQAVEAIRERLDRWAEDRP